jgi:hypothetical protein
MRHISKVRSGPIDLFAAVFVDLDQNTPNLVALDADQMLDVLVFYGLSPSGRDN